jgi:hypothetical protein
MLVLLQVGCGSQVIENQPALESYNVRDSYGSTLKDVALVKRRSVNKLATAYQFNKRES